MKISSALTLLFAAANATPLFEIMERELETLSLEKRDTEIVYLANCVYSVSCCQGPTDYSEIIVSREILHKCIHAANGPR